jgi:hypothetical protein
VQQRGERVVQGRSADLGVVDEGRRRRRHGDGPVPVPKMDGDVSRPSSTTR